MVSLEIIVTAYFPVLKIFFFYIFWLTKLNLLFVHGMLNDQPNQWLWPILENFYHWLWLIEDCGRIGLEYI